MPALSAIIIVTYDVGTRPILLLLILLAITFVRDGSTIALLTYNKQRNANSPTHQVYSENA